MTYSHTPTEAEVAAILRNARRARAEAVASMFSTLVASLRGVFASTRHGRTA